MNVETHGRVSPREDAGPKVEILGARMARDEEVLTPLALQLLGSLHRRFNPRRLELLAARTRRQALLDAGALPEFLDTTAEVRAGDWRIAPVPADLADRRVEITGPIDRKMIINALNAPVRCFMADFEDSCAPTWENIIRGQVNLADAVRRSITFEDQATGRIYRLGQHTATLIVRPRGWHLPEKHVRINGEPVSGALFDFALFLANNHEALARAGTGPYFYLPKIEGHLEARLWNEVFVAAQDALGMARGTIKATVLIETILAAFEMDEILYELREHSAGLNCGRWDYIFSFIKKFSRDPHAVLPDRAQVTMKSNFLRRHSKLATKPCHRRNVHAMGGMSAYIPVKTDPEANEKAIAQVKADKEREAGDGHDGTWVAHPGLVPVALEIFDRLMPQPNQIGKQLPDYHATAEDLLQVPEGQITEAGLKQNVAVGLGYLEAWLRGIGCVPLFNLMEDAATAEISRAQIWQWVHHGAVLENGEAVTAELCGQFIEQELERAKTAVDAERYRAYVNAAALMRELIDAPKFMEFLIVPAYSGVIAAGGAAVW